MVTIEELERRARHYIGACFSEGESGVARVLADFLAHHRQHGDATEASLRERLEMALATVDEVRERGAQREAKFTAAEQRIDEFEKEQRDWKIAGERIAKEWGERCAAAESEAREARLAHFTEVQKLLAELERVKGVHDALLAWRKRFSKAVQCSACGSDRNVEDGRLVVCPNLDCKTPAIDCNSESHQRYLRAELDRAKAEAARLETVVADCHHVIANAVKERDELASLGELAPLRAEIAKGREKYPNGCTILSLLDEAGEVAHAVNKYESAVHVREEILQTAAVAMRLYLGEVDTGLEIDGLVQRRADVGAERRAALAHAYNAAEEAAITQCGGPSCRRHECSGAVVVRDAVQALAKPAAGGEGES